MNNLVLIKNNDIFTDSLVIAEGTGNKHHAIRVLIQKYENKMKDFGKLSFEMRPLASGQKSKIYLLNELQATFLMTLLKNSKTVVDFKFNLTKQFFQMRQLLLQKQTVAWEESRIQGKLTRKAETDTIKQLVEYAKGQGSKNADKLYITYSKLAKKIAGVPNRDMATVSELNNLALIENIILHVIREGITQEKHYKEIYQDCKSRLIEFNRLAYLSA